MTGLNGMPEAQTIYDKAVTLIDAANREDPNRVTADGRDWPKELLYSERMTDMLERYHADADDAMKLAIRAQHIERWKSPPTPTYRPKKHLLPLLSLLSLTLLLPLLLLLLGTNGS